MCMLYISIYYVCSIMCTVKLIPYIYTIYTQAVTTIVGTVCFPIDTIKRRLMMQQRTNGFIPYKNGYDCMYRILQEEGIRGMFSGLSVNLVRGFSGAVLLVAYDDLKHRL